MSERERERERKANLFQGQNALRCLFCPQDQYSILLNFPSNTEQLRHDLFVLDLFRICFGVCFKVRYSSIFRLPLTIATLRGWL